MSKKYIIYTLTDPETNEIRYVGATAHFVERKYQHFYSHKSKKDGQKKHEWIKSLYGKGLRPIMVPIESCTEFDWQEKEKYWIKYYKDSGCYLLNVAIGGQGATGVIVSEEIRKRISDGLKNKPKSKEHIENAKNALNRKFETDTEYKNMMIVVAKKALQNLTAEQKKLATIRRTISLRKRSKINLCLYYKTRKLLEYGMKKSEISKSLNIPGNTLSNCLKKFNP